MHSGCALVAFIVLYSCSLALHRLASGAALDGHRSRSVGLEDEAATPVY